MNESGIGLLEPGTGEQPEDFRFPENKETKQVSETGAPLDEFNFYQDRFQGMTERHNERSAEKGFSGVMKRLVDKKLLENDKPSRPDKVSKEYVIQEMAERENKDFDRRLDKERREWDEKLAPVIESLKLKRDDPENEGKKRKVLIFALGGGLRGPYGAGQVIALNEMGITADKVDVLVGASAGMADLVYYAGGPEQTYIGSSIYYDECTTKEFLDVSRVTHVMDARVAAKSMRSGEKAIDQDAIRRIPTEVYALVTPINEPNAKLVDIKSAKPDMIAPIEASMNVRLIRAPGTEVNGEQAEDGSFGSFEIQQLIDKFHPTDILVLPNIPFRKMAEFKKSTSLLEYIPNAGSPGTIKKFLSVAKELRSMLQEARDKQGVNIGVLWPPDVGLDTLDGDADLIKYGTVEAARDAIRQFGEQQPEKIDLYIPEKFRRKN